MKKLRLLLPFAFLAMAFGLFACGDEAGKEDEIADVIEVVFLGNDPSKCTEAMTPAFIAQIEMTRKEDSLGECEEGVREDGVNDADSVEVSEVEVDGSEATADVAFSGGNYDGQVLTVALLEEDGSWKLDEMARFAKLDKEQLAGAFEEAFEAEDAPGPLVQACFGDTIRDLTQSEIEEVVLSGSPELLRVILKGCSGG